MFAVQDATAVARLRRLAARSVGILAGIAMILAGAGCFAVPENATVSPTGGVITLEQIDSILNNTRLTEEEQREQLRELGLSDELIDVFFRS